MIETMWSGAHVLRDHVRRRVRPSGPPVVGTAGRAADVLACRGGPPSDRRAGRRGRAGRLRGHRAGVGVPAVGAGELRAYLLRGGPRAHRAGPAPRWLNPAV